MFYWYNNWSISCPFLGVKWLEFKSGRIISNICDKMVSYYVYKFPKSKGTVMDTCCFLFCDKMVSYYVYKFPKSKGTVMDTCCFLSFWNHNPKISMHILHTVLWTFHKMPTWRICLTIKSFFSQHGELIYQSRASLVGDQLLYSPDLHVGYRCDMVRRI